MKFGKSLFQVIELSDPEWGPYWINYKYLKKKINDIVLEQEKQSSTLTIQLNDGNILKQQLAKSTAEVEFFKLLKKELKKTSDFFNTSESICKIRRERLWGGLAMLKNQNSFDDTNAWTRLMASCVRFYKDVLLLENYAIMNYCGFSKILKKHDKRTGYSTRDAFMIKVMSKQNFTQYPYIVKQLKEVEAMFEEIQKLHSLQPILEEEKIFIEALRDLNSQASQLQNEENLSVISPSEDLSDASQKLHNNGYYSNNRSRNRYNNHQNNYQQDNNQQEFESYNQDVNQLQDIQNEDQNIIPSSIILSTQQQHHNQQLFQQDKLSDLNSEQLDHFNQLSPSATAISDTNNVVTASIGQTSPLSNTLNDSKNRTDALLEASIRAVVTDPAPNMQSILTWMHSVSTTGALIPIPATTSYLPRGLGQDKSKTKTDSNTSNSNNISVSSITYYTPGQPQPQQQQQQPSQLSSLPHSKYSLQSQSINQSNHSSRFVHPQLTHQKKHYTKSSHHQINSTQYNPTSFSSSSSSLYHLPNERKHSLQSTDIEERYGKKQKAASGTASETNSLVTEEDNSSLHDDNLDGGLTLPDDGETSGN